MRSVAAEAGGWGVPPASHVALVDWVGAAGPALEYFPCTHSSRSLLSMFRVR